jgi:uncharacterized protein YdiU (UPF0061 family)
MTEMVAKLQKRLDLLEGRPTDPELFEQSLSALDDKELSLLEEHTVLLESGFTEAQIGKMMANYKQAQKAATRFHKCYQAAVKAQTTTTRKGLELKKQKSDQAVQKNSVRSQEVREDINTIEPIDANYDEPESYEEA